MLQVEGGEERGRARWRELWLCCHKFLTYPLISILVTACEFWENFFWSLVEIDLSLRSQGNWSLSGIKNVQEAAGHACQECFYRCRIYKTRIFKMRSEAQGGWQFQLPFTTALVALISASRLFRLWISPLNCFKTFFKVVTRLCIAKAISIFNWRC